ncbi:hypothetical protein AG1IA_07190 [Rhizoctonia solani AG-1 IA]|uniref:Uncharacterized protein n=1 Tax=Thanatephorus cucumeris (strain AG1-IA) TaxID=983506 RepID=L8WKU5_THACA|nr:hypothetical protein AG1IA_07190 [Rhizoctonia solani AG-1 IA]
MRSTMARSHLFTWERWSRNLPTVAFHLKREKEKVDHDARCRTARQTAGKLSMLLGVAVCRMPEHGLSTNSFLTGCDERRTSARIDMLFGLVCSDPSILRQRREQNETG